MKRAFLFCLVVSVALFIDCNRVKDPLGPAGLKSDAFIAISVLSPEENYMYRLVLNNIKPGEHQTVLVADSTVYEDFADRVDNIYAEIPGLSPQTVQNYFLRNRDKGHIDMLPVADNNFILVTRDPVNGIYIDANNNIYELRDPEIYGIISLSYIGFNLDKTQAVVSVVDYGAPLDAVSYLVFFVKESDWVIQNKVLLWFS